MSLLGNGAAAFSLVLAASPRRSSGPRPPHPLSPATWLQTWVVASRAWPGVLADVGHEQPSAPDPSGQVARVERPDGLYRSPPPRRTVSGRRSASRSSTRSPSCGRLCPQGIDGHRPAQRLDRGSTQVHRPSHRRRTGREPRPSRLSGSRYLATPGRPPPPPQVSGRAPGRATGRSASGRARRGHGRPPPSPRRNLGCNAGAARARRRPTRTAVDAAGVREERSS